jgi:hypothetical protein
MDEETLLLLKDLSAQLLTCAHIYQVECEQLKQFALDGVVQCLAARTEAFGIQIHLLLTDSIFEKEQDFFKPPNTICLQSHPLNRYFDLITECETNLELSYQQILQLNANLPCQYQCLLTQQLKLIRHWRTVFNLNMLRLLTSEKWSRCNYISIN